MGCEWLPLLMPAHGVEILTLESRLSVGWWCKTYVVENQQRRGSKILVTKLQIVLSEGSQLCKPKKKTAHLPFAPFVYLWYYAR
jgi:hypothetical protein